MIKVLVTKSKGGSGRQIIGSFTFSNLAAAKDWCFADRPVRLEQNPLKNFTYELQEWARVGSVVTL